MGTEGLSSFNVMDTHLEMRFGNPVLTADTFAGVRALGRYDVMTIEGTVNKTAISVRSSPSSPERTGTRRDSGRAGERKARPTRGR